MNQHLSLTRREFLKQSAILGSGAAAFARTSSLRAENAAGNKIVVGIMGLMRGRRMIPGLLGVPNVEIGYLCDVDEKRLAEGARFLSQAQSTPAKLVKDFRRILDDRNVDILAIAAPNFWHTPATIIACSAGKHVYVEKPGSHTPHEAELIVAAARKYKRHVQMGNQRRSYPAIVEAVAKLHQGAIGRLRFARCCYVNGRTSMGIGKVANVPAELDYSLWQGPAPERPYKDNVVHYNWHWLWHWGGGEICCNGVHPLDIARWGLGVDFPRRVAYVGGRYWYTDDQETPDSGTASFDFGDKGIVWEGSSCDRRKPEKPNFVTFYGSDGTLAMSGQGYAIYSPDGTELFKNPGEAGDVPHFRNMMDCIRRGGTLNSEIGDGQISTMLCHLGNIAYRTNSTLTVDPKSGRIIGSPEADGLWRREYRKGWEPRV